MLITSVATLVIALAAYVAYKVRDARNPSRQRLGAANDTDGPIFLRPVSNVMLQELKQALAAERSAQLRAKAVSIEQMKLRRANMQPAADQSNHP